VCPDRARRRRRRGGPGRAGRVLGAQVGIV